MAGQEGDNLHEADLSILSELLGELDLRPNKQLQTTDGGGGGGSSSSTNTSRHSQLTNDSNYTLRGSGYKIIDVQRTGGQRGQLRSQRAFDEHQQQVADQRDTCSRLNLGCTSNQNRNSPPLRHSNEADLTGATSSDSQPQDRWLTTTDGQSGQQSNANQLFSTRQQQQEKNKQRQQLSGETLSSFESDYDLLVYLGETETEDIVDTERSLDYQDQTWRQSICGSASLAPTIDESLADLQNSSPYFDLLGTPLPNTSAPSLQLANWQRSVSRQTLGWPQSNSSINNDNNHNHNTSNTDNQSNQWTRQAIRAEQQPVSRFAAASASPAGAGEPTGEGELSVGVPQSNRLQQFHQRIKSEYSPTNRQPVSVHKPEQSIETRNSVKQVNLIAGSSRTQVRDKQEQQLQVHNQAPKNNFGDKIVALFNNNNSNSYKKQQETEPLDWALRSRTLGPQMDNSPARREQAKSMGRTNAAATMSPARTNRVASSTKDEAAELDRLLAEMSQSLDLDALSRYDTRPQHNGPKWSAGVQNRGHQDSDSRTLNKFQHSKVINTRPANQANPVQQVVTSTRLVNQKSQQQQQQQNVSNESILDDLDGASRMLEQMISDGKKSSEISKSPDKSIIARGQSKAIKVSSKQPASVVASRKVSVGDDELTRKLSSCSSSVATEATCVPLAAPQEEGQHQLANRSVRLAANESEPKRKIFNPQSQVSLEQEQRSIGLAQSEPRNSPRVKAPKVWAGKSSQSFEVKPSQSIMRSSPVAFEEDTRRLSQQREPKAPKLPIKDYDDRVISVEACEMPQDFGFERGDTRRSAKNQMDHMKRRTLSSMRSMRSKLSDFVQEQWPNSSRESRRDRHERSRAKRPAKCEIDRSKSMSRAMPSRETTGEPEDRSLGRQIRERLSRSKSRISKLLMPAAFKRAQSTPSRPPTIGDGEAKVTDGQLFQPGDIARNTTEISDKQLKQDQNSDQDSSLERHLAADLAKRAGGEQTKVLAPPQASSSSSSSSSLSGLEKVPRGARKRQPTRPRSLVATQRAGSSKEQQSAKVRRPSSLLSIRRLGSSKGIEKRRSSDDSVVSTGNKDGSSSRSSRARKRRTKKRRKSSSKEASLPTLTLDSSRVANQQSSEYFGPRRADTLPVASNEAKDRNNADSASYQGDQAGSDVKDTAVRRLDATANSFRPASSCASQRLQTSQPNLVNRPNSADGQPTDSTEIRAAVTPTCQVALEVPLGEPPAQLVDSASVAAHGRRARSTSHSPLRAKSAGAMLGDIKTKCANFLASSFSPKAQRRATAKPPAPQSPGPPKRPPRSRRRSKSIGAPARATSQSSDDDTPAVYHLKPCSPAGSSPERPVTGKTAPSRQQPQDKRMLHLLAQHIMSAADFLQPGPKQTESSRATGRCGAHGVRSHVAEHDERDLCEWRPVIQTQTKDGHGQSKVGGQSDARVSDEKSNKLQLAATKREQQTNTFDTDSTWESASDEADDNENDDKGKHARQTNEVAPAKPIRHLPIVNNEQVGKTSTDESATTTLQEQAGSAEPGYKLTSSAADLLHVNDEKVAAWKSDEPSNGRKSRRLTSSNPVGRATSSERLHGGEKLLLIKSDNNNNSGNKIGLAGQKQQQQQVAISRSSLQKDANEPFEGNSTPREWRSIEANGETRGGERNADGNKKKPHQQALESLQQTTICKQVEIDESSQNDGQTIICKTPFKFNDNLPSPSQLLEQQSKSLEANKQIVDIKGSQFAGPKEPPSSSPSFVKETTKAAGEASRSPGVIQEAAGKSLGGEAGNMVKMATMPAFVVGKQQASEEENKEEDGRESKMRKSQQTSLVKKVGSEQNKGQDEEENHRLSIYENVVLVQDPKLPLKVEQPGESEAAITPARQWRKPPGTPKKPPHLVAKFGVENSAKESRDEPRNESKEDEIILEKAKPAKLTRKSTFDIGGDDEQQVAAFLASQRAKHEQLVQAAREIRLQEQQKTEQRSAAVNVRAERQVVPMSIIQDPNDELMATSSKTSVVGAPAAQHGDKSSSPTPSSSKVDPLRQSANVESDHEDNQSDGNGDNDDQDDTDSSLANALESRQRLISHFEPGTRRAKAEERKPSVGAKFPAFTEGKSALSPSGGSLVKRLASKYENQAAASSSGTNRMPPAANSAVATNRSFDEEPKSESTWYDAKSVELLDEQEVAEFLREFDEEHQPAGSSMSTSGQYVTLGDDDEDELARANRLPLDQTSSDNSEATLNGNGTLNEDDDWNDLNNRLMNLTPPITNQLDDDDEQQSYKSAAKSLTSEREAGAQQVGISVEDNAQGKDPIVRTSEPSWPTTTKGANMAVCSTDSCNLYLANDPLRPKASERERDVSNNQYAINISRPLPPVAAPADTATAPAAAPATVAANVYIDSGETANVGAVQTDGDKISTTTTTTATKPSFDTINNTNQSLESSTPEPLTSGPESAHEASTNNEQTTTCGPVNSDKTFQTTQPIDIKFKNSLNHIIARRSSQQQQRCQEPTSGHTNEQKMATDEIATSRVACETGVKGEGDDVAKSEPQLGKTKVETHKKKKKKRHKMLSRYYYALIKHGKSRHIKKEAPIEQQVRDVIDSSGSSSSSSSLCSSANNTDYEHDDGSDGDERDGDDEENENENDLNDGKLNNKRLVKAAKKCSRLCEELEKILAHRALKDKSSGVKVGARAYKKNDHEEEKEDSKSKDQDRASVISSSSSSSDSQMRLPLQVMQRQNLQKLYHVVNEIHSSESKFVDTLKLLNVDFRGHLEQSIPNQAQDLSLLVPHLTHLPQLQALNENLLEELRLARDQWPQTQRIAHVIVKIGPFLKHYSTYIKEFEFMQQQLVENMRKNAQFCDQVRQFEQSHRAQRLSVQHHLLKPVQRIPQYRLLLQQYLHHLKPDDADYEDTVNALEVVSRVAEHANKSMQEGANFAKLLALQAKIVGKRGDPLVKPGRQLVKEGELLKVSRKQLQPRWFVLLTDALLYLTQFQSSDILYLNRELPLDDCQVECTQSDQEADVNLQAEREFTVCTKTRSFALIAKSRQERDQWVEALRRTVDEYQARRRSFSLRSQLTNPVTGDSCDSTGQLVSASGSQQLSHSSSMSSVTSNGQMQQLHLGHKAPLWTPDSKATVCQLCTSNFTALFRRHHCRACGRVVCSACSSHKAPLVYLKNQRARVCDQCRSRLKQNARLSLNSPC